MIDPRAERPVLVAMTGATGAVYGIRVLETLRDLGVETHLIVSQWADTTIRTDTIKVAGDTSKAP